MIELLRRRRSIRTYLEKAIEPEKIDRLKETVLRAPSSRNLDPWEFIFVEERRLLGQLAACKPHGAGFLGQAALGIVICGDGHLSDVWVEDCAIASILVQMVAQSLGLGSCWIQVRNRAHTDQVSSEQYVQRLLGIPEHIKVESIIAVGYPGETRAPLPDAQLRTSKVHINRF